jgi:hypothetical protein
MQLMTGIPSLLAAAMFIAIHHQSIIQHNKSLIHCHKCDNVGCGGAVVVSLSA